MSQPGSRRFQAAVCFESGGCTVFGMPEEEGLFVMRPAEHDIFTMCFTYQEQAGEVPDLFDLKFTAPEFSGGSVLMGCLIPLKSGTHPLDSIGFFSEMDEVINWVHAVMMVDYLLYPFAIFTLPLLEDQPRFVLMDEPAIALTPTQELQRLRELLNPPVLTGQE